MNFFGAILQRAHDPIFNFYDFLLLATLLQCTLFSIFFLFFKEKHDVQAVFSAFVVSIGLGQLNLFLTYYIPVHIAIREALSLNFFCFSAFITYIQGPLLLEYVRSLTYGKFRFQKRQLIPVVIFFAAILWNPVALHGGVFADIFWRDYVFIGTVGFMVSTVYGLLSVSHLYRYSKELEQQLSSIETINFGWLKAVNIGFLLIWFLQILPPFFYQQVPWVVQQFTTHLKDILILGMISYVVFSSLAHGQRMRAIPHPKDLNEENTSENGPDRAQEELDRITSEMMKHRYYRKYNLTIEAFSKEIDLPVREVSYILNNHYKKNFYEFVNSFRIDEAKELLKSDDWRNKSIQLIYEEVGFRSKSSFNTLFKKHVGTTPSKFRQLDAA